jgi:hypothetical protein
VAWPNDLLAALGPKQRKLLCDWTQKNEMEHGEDYLTVPVLEGMLEMVKAYYPEATVEALEVLSAKSSKNSESLSTIIASQIKEIAKEAILDATENGDSLETICELRKGLQLGWLAALEAVGFPDHLISVFSKPIQLKGD